MISMIVSAYSGSSCVTNLPVIYTDMTVKSLFCLLPIAYCPLPIANLPIALQPLLL